MSDSPARRALVVGSTGIVGQALSASSSTRAGRSSACPAAAAARSRACTPSGPTSPTRTASRGPRRRPPGFVAITAWTRQATEAENIAVNGAAVRNVLAALEPAGTLEHVALMTGLKHYLGPFEAYATGVMADTPFHEEEPRLDSPNFYYAQEDELFAAAARSGFTWSVHRSHTVFGFATGNAMNMVLTIARVRHDLQGAGPALRLPRLGHAVERRHRRDRRRAARRPDDLGRQHEAGRDEAFNIANGDVFRWRWLWPQIAAYFGLEWEGFEGEPRTARRGDGGMEPRLDRHRRPARPRRAGPRPGRLLVAHRRRPRPRDRGADRHEQEPDRRLHRRQGHPRRFFAYIERYRAARILP